MKKIYLVIIVAMVSAVVRAQIPYFAGTAGEGNLYGYTSLKFRPGINAQETYTTFQYGIGNQLAAGADLYTGEGAAYWGVIVRWGRYFGSSSFGIGAQVTPSFNLNDNFKYSYTVAALYLNGRITSDGKLFWCSNTWWNMNRGAADAVSNWEYIGYTFNTGRGQSVTPMVGAIHSWKFDQDIDLAFGAYYTIGRWNIYAWGNDFLKAHPRLVVGIDFKLPTP